MCSLLKLFPLHCSIKLQPLIKPVITSFTTRNSLFDGCLITILNTTLKSLGYNCIVSFLMRGICICSAVTLSAFIGSLEENLVDVMMMSSVGYENWNLLHWFRGVATKDEEPQKKKKKRTLPCQMTQQLCNLGPLKERSINLASYLTHTCGVQSQDWKLWQLLLLGGSLSVWALPPLPLQVLSFALDCSRR